MTIKRIILVPGLVEPRFIMLPLKYSLRRSAGEVDVWKDRLVFRRLEQSVDRLAAEIRGDGNNQNDSIALVSHSFGDWVARAAIAKQPDHRVSHLVSVAPVMRAGALAYLAYALGGGLAPEMRVIMNRERAAENVDLDARVQRLVIWSRLDESLREIDLTHLPNVDVRRVWGTHFTVIVQANVRRMIGQFLFG